MNKELTVVQPLNDNAINTALQQAGLQQAGSGYSRITLKGNVFEMDGEYYMYNPKTDAPAFKARIMGPVVQYQALWFRQEEAQVAGRPDIVDQFCKSFFDNPTQARKRAEDGTSCVECPFNPFIKGETLTGRKCAWKGDIQLQIIPENGQLTGAETIGTLTLSQTAVMAFVGTRQNKNDNFMYKLAKLGSELTPDNPLDGLNAAIASYNNGGVVVEVRVENRSNASGSFNWEIPIFTPVEFYDMSDNEQTPAQLAEEIFAEDIAGPRNVTPEHEPGRDPNLPF